MDRIRQILNESGCKSYTSIQYQNDVLAFIAENAHRGGDIIEVGCYRGGLTAQLAYIAQNLSLRLHVVDNDGRWIRHTDELLDRLDLAGEFHLGTLSQFVCGMTFRERPLLILLDADHRFDAVMEDIRAIKMLNPYAVAFHDYSLRHVSGEYAIDRAILEQFGQDIPLTFLGQKTDDLNGGDSLEFQRDPFWPGKNNPHPIDGWYWEKPGHEGVILLMPQGAPK